MKAILPRAAAFALALAALQAFAQAAPAPPADTLTRCLRGTAEPAQAAACVQLAQARANDDMLGAFRAAQQTLTALDRAAGGAAFVQALTASQREFERYVQAQCTLAHAVFARAALANVAALACETDLLLQRVEVLQSYARPSPRN
jgi:uncharacterized protein YecT (DUF1311 family)